MATYPFRNRLIAQHDATRYYTGQDKGIVSDLLAPADDARKMAFSSTSGVVESELNSWQDRVVSMPAGVTLQYDYASERPKLNEEMVLLKLGIDTSFFDGADLIRDLACFSPVQGETTKGAAVVTAVRDLATSHLKLFAQAYSGSSWISYPMHDFGVVGDGDFFTVYIVAGNGPFENQATVSVYIPGAVDVMLPQVAGVMELIQIGSTDYMAGNDPSVGAPPVSGTNLPMAFMLNTALPVFPWWDQWFALGKVDQKGWTIDFGATIWPADNSSGVLVGPISAGALYPTIQVSPGDALLAPGQYDRMLATLVDPTDPSIRETVQVMSVDVLSGEVKLLRERPLRAWPAGTQIKGLLRNEHSLPTVSDQIYLFPGEILLPEEKGESEVMFSSNGYLNMSGDSWTLKFPNGRRFMISRVGLVSGPDLTAATISVGVPGSPTSILDNMATPAMVGNTRWFSTAEFDFTMGNDALVVTVTGGTGVAKAYLKGVFDPL